LLLLLQYLLQCLLSQPKVEAPAVSATGTVPYLDLS
jgi:hypothetical protein